MSSPGTASPVQKKLRPGTPQQATINILEDDNLIEFFDEVENDQQYMFLKDMFSNMDESRLKEKFRAARFIQDGFNTLISELTENSEQSVRCNKTVTNPNTVHDAIESVVQNSRFHGADPQPGPSGMQQIPRGNVPDVDADIPKAIAKHVSALSDIFADADPDYIMRRAAECQGDDGKFDILVEEMSVKSESYPKLRDYLARKKLDQEHKRYMGEDWSLTDFLNMFPDPKQYFFDIKRSTTQLYKDHAFAFIKKEFPFTYTDEIRRVLIKNNYVLAPSYESLKATESTAKRKTPRRPHECGAPQKTDLPFLQDAAFVKHQFEISQHFFKEEQKRENARKEARETNSFLECQCCFDSEVLLMDAAACYADHMFCKTCIRRGCEAAVGSGKIKFECFAAGCNLEFPLPTVQDVLKPSVFSMIMQQRQLEEIQASGLEDVVSCPFCSFMTIMPNPNDKVFRCLRPDCMRESCRLCKEPNHVPLRCDQVEKDTDVKARTFIENSMTEAMIRKCWNCQKCYFKEEGCNKMTCVCGKSMCYICKQPVTNYDHFHKGVCPLWSDSQYDNALAVREVANIARQKMQREDVKLVHDPTLILPTVPKPKPQPHFVPLNPNNAAHRMPHHAHPRR